VVKISKLIYTYVCGDILHIGHLKYLESAKRLGDKLVVGVLTEEAIMEKKSKPTIPFEERLELIDNLKCVDLAIGQHTYSPITNIKLLRPSILVESESHSQKDIENAYEVIKEWEGKVVVLPYYKLQSSTTIKQKLKENEK